MSDRKIYRKTDVMKHFDISKYRVAQWLADGILPAPIRRAGQHGYWTARQIQTAEKRLDELAAPAPKASAEKTIRPFNAKQKSQIRAYAEEQQRIREERWARLV